MKVPARIGVFVLAALVEAALVALLRGFHPLACTAAAGIFYLIAAAVILRRAPDQPPLLRLRWLVLVAVVFRVTLLPLGPSPQLARYRWEGKILHAGFNPYAYAPANALFNPIRATTDAAVPAADLGSFHPPVAEYLFHWSYLWSQGPRSQKVFFTALDLLLILALAGALRRRQKPREWAMLYAWSPLPVIAIAGGGHMEAAAGLLLLLALDWAARRPARAAMAGIATGLAAMTQWYALVLAPAVLFASGRRWRRALLWGLVVGGLVWFPYAFAAQHQVLTTAFHNVRAHLALPPFHASLFALASAWFGRDTAAVVSVAVVLAAVVMTRKLEPLRAAAVVLGALLVASPWVHPWTLLWLLPFVAVTPEPAWLVFSVTVLFPSVWAEYVPLFGLLAWQAWQSYARRMPRSASA